MYVRKNKKSVYSRQGERTNTILVCIADRPLSPVIIYLSR